MRRFYAPYWMWEDVQHGMYSTESQPDEQELIQNAVLLLSDVNLFQQTLHKVIKQWPLATRCNLTNKGCNRQAWLGQAACSYAYGVPETLTREAWARLTDIQRKQANQVAQKFITSYELSYGRQDQTVCV